MFWSEVDFYDRTAYNLRRPHVILRCRGCLWTPLSRGAERLDPTRGPGMHRKLSQAPTVFFVNFRLIPNIF